MADTTAKNTKTKKATDKYNSPLYQSCIGNVYKFCSHRKIYFIISACLIIIAICSSFFGLKLNIDFRGGSILTYSYTSGDINSDDIKDIVADQSDGVITVQTGEDLKSGEGKSISISIASKKGLTDDQQQAITKSISDKYPDSNIELVDSNSVNATNGRDFFVKCILAVILAGIILVIYIAIRFRMISGWSAGIFATVALLHDIIITYGAYIIMGFEINSNFMAAILTIFGYSINDTIVIYDRIRENQRLYPGSDLNDLVDVSISQTLRRSIRTSVTTVSCMVIISIVCAIMGLTSILSLSLSLCVGLTVGTYSSICIAPQLWIAWNERRGKKTLTVKSKKVKKA